MEFCSLEAMDLCWHNTLHKKGSYSNLVIIALFHYAIVWLYCVVKNTVQFKVPNLRCVKVMIVLQSNDAGTQVIQYYLHHNNTRVAYFTFLGKLHERAYTNTVLYRIMLA